MLKKIFGFLIFAFVINTSICQEPTFNRPIPDSRTINVADGIDSVNIDTSTNKRNTFKTIFQGKPGKAALYSLIIPAGGQAYNKKWLKIPLALGIDGYLTYNLINKRKIFNTNDKLFKSYTEASVPMTPPSKVVNDRANSRREKEYALVYLIIGHIITVFDAYVDRHLKEFDLNEDISERTEYERLDFPIANFMAISYKF